MSIAVGALLAFLSGIFIAIGMVVQRYALVCPTYIVPLGKLKLNRPHAWTMGFALYMLGNLFMTGAHALGLLSINSTLNILLVVWNMLLARIYLGEMLTPPRIIGSALILVGAPLICLGAPTNAKNEFSVQDIEDLIVSAGGLVYWIVTILSTIGTVAGVLWFEREYTITEEEKTEREFRRHSLASAIIFEGKEAIVNCKTPAEMRWKVARAKVRASLIATGAIKTSNFAELVREASDRTSGMGGLQGIPRTPFLPMAVAAAPGDEMESEGHRERIAPPAAAAAQPAAAPAVAEATREVTEGRSGGCDGEGPGGAATASGGDVGCCSGVHASGAGPLSDPPRDGAGPSSPPPSPPPQQQAGTSSRASAKQSAAKQVLSRQATKRKLAPAWLNTFMSYCYPSSLGLLEAVTQVTIKCIAAMLTFCFSPSEDRAQCYSKPWLYIAVVIFAIVAYLTVVWLKIVYTRYEVTLGLPIEYGVVQVASVLAGVVFFKESETMNEGESAGAVVPTTASMYACVFAGLFIVTIGSFVSGAPSLPCLPKRSPRVGPEP